jgi:hypothetical protein
VAALPTTFSLLHPAHVGAQVTNIITALAKFEKYWTDSKAFITCFVELIPRHPENDRPLLLRVRHAGSGLPSQPQLLRSTSLCLKCFYLTTVNPASRRLKPHHTFFGSRLMHTTGNVRIRGFDTPVRGARPWLAKASTLVSDKSLMRLEGKVRSNVYSANVY